MIELNKLKRLMKEIEKEEKKIIFKRIKKYLEHPVELNLIQKLKRKRLNL